MQLEAAYYASAERNPLAPASMQATTVSVVSATKPALYRRADGTNSEDFGGWTVMPDGSMLAIAADGMGGHSHGDKAARIVVAAFETAMTRLLRERKNKLSDAKSIQRVTMEALEYAHRELNSVAALKGTGAGVVLIAMVAVPLGNGKYRVVVPNIGDARGYLIRAGQPLLNLSMDGWNPSAHRLDPSQLFLLDDMKKSFEYLCFFVFWNLFRGI